MNVLTIGLALGILLWNVRWLIFIHVAANACRLPFPEAMNIPDRPKKGTPKQEEAVPGP